MEQLRKQVESKYPVYGDKPVDISVIYGTKQAQQPQVNVQISYHSTDAYAEEAERQRAKQDAKYQKLLQTQMMVRKDAGRATGLLAVEPISLYRSAEQSTQSNKPDLSSFRSSSRALAPAGPQKNDTLKIKCTFEHSKEVYLHMFDIHRSRDTTDIIKKVISWLRIDFKYDGPDSSVYVYSGNQQLQKGKALKDIFSDSQEVSLKVSLQPFALEATVEAAKSELVLDNQQAPQELLPKAPKEGYQLTPFNYSDLVKLQVTSLEQVKDFTVSNEFGSILWQGKTDLTRVDLQDVVTITQGSCEVYDDQRHTNKPSVGQKLNKPAIITLKNIRPLVNQSITAKEQKLKRMIEKSGEAEHLSYDGNEWQFKVQHFTKWGEGSDDDDDEMADEAPQPAQPLAVPVTVIQPAAQVVEEVDMRFENEKSRQKTSEQSPNIFKNLVQQKRFHLAEAPSPQQTSLPIIVPRIEQSPKSFAAQQVTVAATSCLPNETNKILSKIKLREATFASAASFNNVQKPSDYETAQFFKQMGLKNLKRTSLGRRCVPKPCFHPSGKGILSAHRGTITLHKLPEIQHPQDLSDVIEKHTSQSLQSQLSNLNLDQSQDQIMSDSTVTVKDRFEDEFFRTKVLQSDLAQISFFCTQQQVNDFLVDAARHYSRSEASTNQPKMQHEFYVVCMLNALYGDSCVPLNQLHRKQKGSELQFAMKAQGNMDEDSLAMAKKRRNAVTETMRLLCQQQFPVHTVLNGAPTDSQICQVALELLQVGDVRQAVQFLNKHRKTKVSLLVSQSVSNQFSLSQVEKIAATASEPERKIYQYICGKTMADQWEKRLLQELMYTRCHSEHLRNIIAGFAQKQKKEDSLLWKLLLVYARTLGSDKGVHEMTGRLTPAHDNRDYRLRWITQLVLRSALLHQQLSRTQKPDGNKWTCHIPDSVLTATSSLYIYQLLMQNQQKQAMQVALLIPQQVVRRRLIFEILMRNASIESFKEQSDLCEQLQIPTILRMSALALKMQSGNQASQAVNQWLQCGNVVQAEDLYRRMVLPNQLKKQVTFKLMKLLYCEQPQSFGQSQNHLPVTQMDRTIIELKTRYPSKELWDTTPCGLLLRIRNAQRELVSKQLGGDLQLIYSELTMISDAIDGHRSSSDAVYDWMRSEVTEMILALRARKSGLSFEAPPKCEGIAKSQAMRGTELILVRSLVDASH